MPVCGIEMWISSLRSSAIAMRSAVSSAGVSRGLPVSSRNVTIRVWPSIRRRSVNVALPRARLRSGGTSGIVYPVGTTIRFSTSWMCGVNHAKSWVLGGAVLSSPDATSHGSSWSVERGSR